MGSYILKSLKQISRYNHIFQILFHEWQDFHITLFTVWPPVHFLYIQKRTAIKGS